MSSPGDAEATALFHQLFDAHPAHVVLLGIDGRILATNPAWDVFGAGNGLAGGYEFVGVDYIGICERAVADGSPYAQEALLGLVALLAGAQRQFVLRYPCHAPHENRWFKMYAELQTPESQTLIIAHSYLGPTRPIEASDPLPISSTSPGGWQWPQASRRAHR